MKNSHTIIYDGISLYVTGFYDERDEEVDSGGGFGLTEILLQDHEGNEKDILHWFGNSAIEEINIIVTEENY
jgi:hypothetical protein